MGLAKMPRHVLDLKKMVILHINLHWGHLVMHFFVMSAEKLAILAGLVSTFDR
jgi:hypothetical protein